MHPLARRKIDFQSKLYEETLTPFRDRWGYAPALWCATYSLGMVPIVDLSQPNSESSGIRMISHVFSHVSTYELRPNHTHGLTQLTLHMLGLCCGSSRLV